MRPIAEIVGIKLTASKRSVAEERRDNLHKACVIRLADAGVESELACRAKVDDPPRKLIAQPHYRHDGLLRTCSKEGRPMFIRFVVGGEDESHRLLTGLVTEARMLRDSGALATYEIELLEATYDWLNERLPCPPFSSAGWSRDAVSWFKDTATDAIKQMRELAVLLESHGLLVRMLRSENPGKVLYEDRFQVVVEEWKRL